MQPYYHRVCNLYWEVGDLLEAAEYGKVSDYVANLLEDEGFEVSFYVNVLQVTYWYKDNIKNRKELWVRTMKALKADKTRNQAKVKAMMERLK